MLLTNNKGRECDRKTKLSLDKTEGFVVFRAIYIIHLNTTTEAFQNFEAKVRKLTAIGVKSNNGNSHSVFAIMVENTLGDREGGLRAVVVDCRSEKSIL